MDYTDISLKKFRELFDIATDTDITEEDKVIYEIQILFDVNPLNLDLKSFKNYLGSISFLNKKIPSMKLRDYYILNGTKYNFCKKLNNISVAQWMDYQNYVKQGFSHENYSNIISVLFIPDGFNEYGEGYDVEKVKSDIDNYLSIADAVSIASFFLRWRKAYTIVSLLYTRHKILKKTPMKMRERMKVRMQFLKAIKEIMVGD